MIDLNKLCEVTLANAEQRQKNGGHIKTDTRSMLKHCATEVVEAMDMDQMVNPQVRNGILAMRKEVMKIPNIKYSKYTWNPAYKGVDDYFLSRVAAM